MLASNCENNSLLEDLCQELSGIKLENGLERTNIESLEGRRSMPQYTDDIHDYLFQNDEFGMQNS